MFRTLFPIMLETPADGGSGAPAAAPPEAAAPAAPPAPAGDAPWSSDLAGLGLDASSLAAVDGYIRERWQPRMTQYEQQVRELAPAQELWKDFHEDPDGTFVAVGAQLFGEDKVAALQEVLAAQAAAAEAPTSEPLDPRLQALLDEREQVEQKTAYDAAVAQVKEAKPDLVEEWFHPFVVAAEGHMDEAVTRYDQWLTSVQSRFAPAEEQAPAPPATLGGGGQDGPAAPPVSEKYASLDDALDATLADMRRAQVAPVGTV